MVIMWFPFLKKRERVKTIPSLLTLIRMYYCMDSKARLL